MSKRQVYFDAYFLYMRENMALLKLIHKHSTYKIEQYRRKKKNNFFDNSRFQQINQT